MVEWVREKGRVIFAGRGDWQPDDEFQHSLILFLLLLCGATLLVFSPVNYLYGHHWLALQQLVTFLVCAPLYYARRNRLFQRYSREIFITFALISFVALIADGGIDNTGIYWSLTYPFFAFLLMGVKQGWRWVGLFVLLYLLLSLLHGLQIIYLPYSDEVFTYLPCVFIFSTILACAFQLHQEYQQHMLRSANMVMRERERELVDARMSLERIVQARTEQLKKINKKLSEEVDEKIEAMEKYRFSEMKYRHAQKMEALGTLVGGIAHDFNNMLSGINANLYLLQIEAENTPEMQARIGKIDALTKHAADIIQQLLTFARKSEVELQLFDLRSFLKEAYKLARLSLPEHVRFEGIFPDEDIFIRGEPTQIHQIMMNLVNNARDALEGVKDPFVTISLSSSIIDAPITINHQKVRAGRYAILSVQDNGCGITEEELERIFEPFYTTKPEGVGTGLGLAMVYGAVQSHDGYLDLVSYPGNGTRFSIYFPTAEREEVQDQSEQPVMHGEGETILLVDDDLELLTSTKLVLKSLGYNPLVAQNGAEALELYRQWDGSIELMLLDVVMPELDGPAVALEVRRHHPEAKILFMSGYDSERESPAGLEQEWRSMLKKPFQIDQLSRAIREYLSPAANKG